MKMYKKITPIIIIGLIIGSCSKENEAKIIEAELQAYIDLFTSEAEEREVEIDLSEINLGAYIKNIEENGTIGQCISYSDGSKDIVIDERNWDRLDELEKEYVVFHELGHCVLNRSHNNMEDSNGLCQSIMQSGEGQCQSHYDMTNRNQLLEELFKN